LQLSTSKDKNKTLGQNAKDKAKTRTKKLPEDQFKNYKARATDQALKIIIGEMARQNDTAIKHYMLT
jgi:hypothetical protein